VTSRRSGRRASGFLLAETLTALVVGLILLTAVASLLTAAHRQDGVLRRRLAARRGVDAVLAVLRTELAAAAGVSGISESTVVLRAGRGFGVVCGRRAGALLVGNGRGSRLPDPGRDSLRVLDAGRMPWGPGPAWRSAPLRSAGAASCDDGRPGLSLGTDSLTALARDGAPIWIVETVEYRAYRDAAGSWWLGARGADTAGWNVTTPVAGPVAARGIAFAWRDATGAATGDPDSVAAVSVVVRGAAVPAESVAVALAVRWP